MGGGKGKERTEATENRVRKRRGKREEEVERRARENKFEKKAWLDVNWSLGKYLTCLRGGDAKVATSYGSERAKDNKLGIWAGK